MPENQHVDEVKRALREQGIFSTELQARDVEEILKNTIPDLLQRPEVKNEVDEAELKEVAVLLREKEVNLKVSISVRKMLVSGDIGVALEVGNDEVGDLQLKKIEIVSENPFINSRLSNLREKVKTVLEDPSRNLNDRVLDLLNKQLEDEGIRLTDLSLKAENGVLKIELKTATAVGLVAFEAKPEVPQGEKEATLQPPLEETVEGIQEVLAKNKSWRDLEETEEQETQKTDFFNKLRRLFLGISQQDIEQIKALSHEPLSRAFAQYPETALILGKYLVGEEREVINMGDIASGIMICLSKKEYFPTMEPYQREAVLAQLTKNFGGYLWGIGLMRGKGNYEQRREHAGLLLEKVLGTFPEVGQRVAKKIAEL